MSNFALTTAESKSYYEKYLTLLHDATKSQTFKAHYEIAFYIPILFIRNEATFEATFDGILSHLEIAYKKANNEKAQEGVMQSIQFLLNFHVDMVESAIMKAQSASADSLIERIKDSIQNTFKEFFTAPELSDVFVVTEAAKILNAYHSYFVNKRNIKKFEKRFYPQLAHVYSKVLDSPLYSSELTLVSNSFNRVDKQQILLPALHEKGLAITLNMLRKFNMPKDDLGQSLRFIVSNLYGIQINDNDLKVILRFADEQELINREEIKRGLIDFYKQVHKPETPTKNSTLPIAISLIIALFVYVGLFIQGIHVTKVATDNFLTMAGKYIVAIGGSLLTSLYWTCGLMAIVIGLVIVISIVVSHYQEKKLNEKAREFEKELDLISK